MMKTVAWMTAAALFLPGATALAQEEITARPVGDDTPAAAQETAPSGSFRRDDAWNSPWALHFALPNWFTNSSVLEDYNEFGGMIGASYHLDKMTALRLGLYYQRSSSPTLIQKTTDENGPNREVDYVHQAFSTADHELHLHADFVKRFGAQVVAPYAGAGVYYSYNRSRTYGKDEVDVVREIEHVNNVSSGHELGVRGLIGGEWRIHPHFALYAEYGVLVSLFEVDRFKNQTTTERTVSDVRTTSRTTTERAGTSYLNIQTSLQHGFSLGLAIHFEP